MNYPYLQAQEVVVLDQDYSDIKLSGMLNGKTTANKSLPNALKTDISITHQYLAMSEHSSVKGTPEDIEEWLILSAAASLANPSQSQVSEMLKMTSEICGQQRKMSFPRLNLSMRISKTYQAYCRLEQGEWRTGQTDMFADTSETYCETFTKWGWMQNGELSELMMSVDTTEENGYGYFATPNTMDSLPPKSPEALLREMTIARPGRSKPANLRDQVSNQQNWPTPASRDYKGGRKAETLEKAGRNENNSLPDKVNASEGQTGQLNADWVEVLMGWPQSWSSLEPLDKLNWDTNWAEWEPDIPRVVTRQKDRAKRLKAIGNGQVPLTNAVAWKVLYEEIYGEVN